MRIGRFGLLMCLCLAATQAAAQSIIVDSRDPEEPRSLSTWLPFAFYTEWLAGLDIDWWQVVAFAEVGRVAPEWRLSTFAESPRWDVGVGLRALTRKTLIRLDLAASDDAFGVWVMVGQSF